MLPRRSTLAVLLCLDAACAQIGSARISMNGATLSTSCSHQASTVAVEGSGTAAAGSIPVYAPDQSVRLYFRGVPDNCVYSIFASDPCRAHALHIPPLWWCSFSNLEGVGDPLVTGPYRAGVLNFTGADGASIVGSEVVLDCPLPPRNNITNLVNPVGAGNIRFNVSAVYGEQSRRSALPWAGVQGGNTLTFVPTPPGGSADVALDYISQADGLGGGNMWLKTSASSAQQLHFVEHKGKAWARVMLKYGAASGYPSGQPVMFTTGHVGAPADFLGTSKGFKLSDTELNYITSTSSNPDALGVVLVTNAGAGHTYGNLLRSNGGSRAYPIGSSIIANGGDMAKFNLDLADGVDGAWPSVACSRGNLLCSRTPSPHPSTLTACFSCLAARPFVLPQNTLTRPAG